MDVTRDPASRHLDGRGAREPDPSLARLLETEARLRRMLQEREAEARRIVEAANTAALERERRAEEELAEAEAALRERVRRDVERERRELRDRAARRIRTYRRARHELVPELARWVAARVLDGSDP